MMSLGRSFGPGATTPHCSRILSDPEASATDKAKLDLPL
jgi:hypothetical protein